MKMTLGAKTIKMMKQDLKGLNQLIKNYEKESEQYEDLKDFKRYRKGIKNALSYYGITTK